MNKKISEPKRILVIEDDIGLNRLIQKKLSTEGYMVTGVHSGDEALSWLKNNDFDLILVDYILENTDARKILKRLQKNRISPIPFVIITGNGDERVAVEMMKLGALDYLIKDAAFIELLPSIVKQVLEYIQTENNLKLYQKELEQSEMRYRLLAESTNDMIDKKNVDARFIYVSPVCKQILGYNENELLHKYIYDFIHPDERDIYEKYHQELLLDSEKSIVKYRFRKRNGQYIWFETNTKVLRNPESNNVVELVSVSRDITEQINTDRLIKEKEAAELANKAKSEFLANMSHEIRNPMNAIIGMTNTLFKTNLTADQQKFINAIKISSTNLMNLINDILDFSKIEAKHIEVNNIDFNIRALIEEIVFLYEHQASEKQLKLLYDIKPNTHCDLNGDGLKLKQILINLVNNAIKFTDKGYVKIVVEQLNESVSAVELKIKVEDTGIGIRKEDFGKLFKLFTQLDSSPSKRYAGTGLGLTIVKRLTEILSGNINFESDYGVGSCFIITVPFNKSNKTVLTYEDLWQETKPHANLDNLQVLLAEDDGINQLYLKNFLQSYNCKVDTAFNGEQVLEKFNSYKYDIILMDGQMPKLDGFETTQMIRQIEKDKNYSPTPIVAITGYATAGDRERFINAGMDDYVTKPINENKLIDIIKKYCKENRKN